MQYKQKLEKNGLTEAELTPRIKSMIADLKEAMKEKSDLEKDLKDENYEDEDAKEEMESALEEINELISETDAEVSDKVSQFAKNKRAREKSSTNQTPQINNSGKIEVTKEGSITTTTTQKPENDGEIDDKIENKKSGSGVLWGLLGIGALVLTFGTVNLFSGDE